MEGEEKWKKKKKKKKKKEKRVEKSGRRACWYMYKKLKRKR